MRASRARHAPGAAERSAGSSFDAREGSAISGEGSLRRREQVDAGEGLEGCGSRGARERSEKRERREEKKKKKQAKRE
jgi:hypothetical protein